MLKAAEARQALSDWRAVLFGTAMVLLVTPLAGIPAMALPLRPRELAVGLAVFSAMPTSLSSCVTLTQVTLAHLGPSCQPTTGAIGRCHRTPLAVPQMVNGNAALALLLVAITNTAGIFTAPFVLQNVLCTTMGVNIEPRPLLLALVQVCDESTVQLGLVPWLRAATCVK